MAAVCKFEGAVVSVASLSKSEVISRLRGFDGSFRLDFSDDYLEKQDVDKLRHILLAAMVTKLSKKGA